MEFSCCILTVVSSSCLYIYTYSGVQLVGAKSPWQIHFGRWRKMFLGGQCGTRLTSPFRRPEF